MTSRVGGAPSPAPAPPVTYAGWVYKEGSLVRSWKKRFLVVKCTELAYYKTSDHQSRNAQIMGSMRIHRVERAPNITNGLLVHGMDGRILKLFMDTPEEFDKCFTAIQQWCNTDAQERPSRHGAWSSHRKSGDAAAPGVRHTGWLYKQGAQFPVWNRRYFELKGNLLTYAEKPGTAPLGRNRVVGVRRDTTKAFTLAIMLDSGRELRVTGASEMDIYEWQRKLRQSLRRNILGPPAASPPAAMSAPPPPEPVAPQRQDLRAPVGPDEKSWKRLFAGKDEEDTSPRELQHLPSFGESIQFEEDANEQRHLSFIECNTDGSAAAPAQKPYSPHAPGRNTILEMRVAQKLITPEEAQQQREEMARESMTQISQDDGFSTTAESNPPPGPCCCQVM